MTTRLIADAARSDNTRDDETIWDRIIAFCLRRAVSTQNWADPEADLAAMRLPLGSTIVTASSTGCSALSYLTAQPAQVYAVDLGDAHLALLKLKLAGVRAFSSYEQFWQFFGEGASVANERLYLEQLRPLLDEQARTYWERPNVFGRPRYTYFNDGFFRHGLLGRTIGLALFAARLARVDPDALLSGDADSSERVIALTRMKQLFHTGLMRFVTRAPRALAGAGIAPWSHAMLGAERPLNEVLHERLLRLVNGTPEEVNYFAWQALARRYPAPGDRGLPPYLQRRHFASMRNDAGVIIPVHAGLLEFLQSLPAREVDAVALSNSHDCLASETIRPLWDAIDRAGSERACVIFRTAGTESPLERRPELSSLRQSWRRDDERSSVGFELDRSAIHGGFHCYVRR
jgi:S-adenosylmethionine-diacylglycerol 3-amino-3-carboxypropyl transferase